MVPDPRCDTCIGGNIGCNAIPVCLTSGCPKIEEYYPDEAQINVKRIVWKDFTDKLEPKE